jgi:hypothetical protein
MAKENVGKVSASAVTRRFVLSARARDPAVIVMAPASAGDAAARAPGGIPEPEYPPLQKFPAHRRSFSWLLLK